MTGKREHILVVLTSLTAEGTPRLALELCRHWLRLGLRPIVVVLQPEPADLAPDFDAVGVKRVVIGIGKGYARYFKLMFHLFALTRKYRAATLLSMPFGWHTFMALGARAGGIRRVLVHVGSYPNAGTAAGFRKFRFLVQAGRPFTDKLICCSNYVKEGVLEKFGVPEGETAVIYNGAPLDTFEARAGRARSKRAAGEPLRIGMVARLDKGQSTLIRAARILKDRGIRVEVWLIGEGRHRKEFEALIDSEGVADSVKLLGMRRDVPELVGQLDVFAFCAAPEEGLGIALIEAMAAGVPIVASDVRACREVLDEGALGKLVPVGEPLALAGAIEAIRADPAAAAERARQARDKAFRDFSMEQMADAYAALLGLSHDATQPAAAVVST